MFNAVLDSGEFAEKLKIFSSGLGNMARELLKTVGEEMAEEAKRRATFQNRTGRLFNSIKFLIRKDIGAITTRKTMEKSNVFYARMVEADRTIRPKKGKYLTFKINGEWKRVESVTVKGRPFITPVFNEYFGNESGRGYKAMAAALERKINEAI